MHKIIVIASMILLSSFNTVNDTPPAKKTIHKFKVEALDGSTIDFSKFKGKKVLVVNTASKCGYTPQYESLEKLYEKYSDKLVIVGFPANNFGQQEPGSNVEIQEFCKKITVLRFLWPPRFPLKEMISPQFLNGLLIKKKTVF